MSRLSTLLRRHVWPHAEATRVVAPLHRPGFPIAVCWSAKAGCTTLLKWFLDHTGMLDAALAHHPWPHEYRCRVLMAPLTDYVTACTAAVRSGDVEVVKVVRDPARRAVSSYIHLVRMESDPGWNPGVRAWKRRVGLGRQPGLSFEQFLHFVIDARLRGWPSDLHFQSQWQPAWDGFVDHVIRLEHLADELAALEDRHGLPRADLRRLSGSDHHNPPVAGHRWPRDAATFAVTGSQLAALGVPPAEAFLDACTIALIRQAYACDYEAYGHLYDEPCASPLRRAG